MRAVGTANAWFAFKGIRNDVFDVRMVGMPTRPRPAEKGKYIDIPGTNGRVWQSQRAYDRIPVTQRVVANDNANIDDINAWLDGEGDLIFGDEPERVYHARITKEISRANQTPRLRGQAFTINFDCEPFRYSANAEGESVTAYESAFPIPNPGTVYSEPLIIVNGSGSGTLQIGQNTMFFEDLTAGVPLYVDCAAKIAYTGTGAADDPMLPATQHTGGEWMRIAPGPNFINIDGGITSVTVHPRWRWL